MDDHRSHLTSFSQKIAFFDKNFVIVWPISMKLEIWVDININLSLLKC